MREKEDVKTFGKNQLVYCRSHMRPHGTGWCNVSVDEKIGLGIAENEQRAAQKAYEKCHEWGLPIFGEKTG